VLRKCISGESESEWIALDAVNRRGKPIRCEVTCSPLRTQTEEIRGAILLMKEQGNSKG
jgi:two-component system CheB/CheR fusion protein